MLIQALSKANPDEVLCLICSTAVNQDGRSANLTSPNGLAQESVIKSALNRGALGINDIDFIEAHGTGTRLGDPQEVQSIANVFFDTSLEMKREQNHRLWLGAVKTNIGHLEAAAGIY